MFKKVLPVSGLWILSCSAVFAASISGKVVDEGSGLPIGSLVSASDFPSLGGSSYPNIQLYKYDDINGYWTWQNIVYPDQNGNFTFSTLPAGSYYIWSSAPAYSSEYYNNTTDWAAKKTLKLSATQNLSLQQIALKPYPYSVASVIPSTYKLPVTGGTVTLQVKIANRTLASRAFKVWAMANIFDTTTSINAEYPVSKDPVSLTLLPGTNEVNIPFSVPASHRNGNISVNVFGGSSYGNPLMPSGYTSVFKGAVVTSPIVSGDVAGMPEQGEDIPLRIANDGKVLLKGKVVKP